MDLVLFFVWENARVWVHWNHSFDMHLSYLGPVSCSFPSWVPSGCTTGDGTVAEGLAAPWFSSWVPSGPLSGQVMTDRLMATASFGWWYGRPHFSFTGDRDRMVRSLHRSPTHRKWPLVAHYDNDAPLPLTSASPSFLTLWQCWIKQNAPSRRRLKTCPVARDYLCFQASWERNILTETLASALSCIWYFWENINLCLSSVVPHHLTNIMRVSSNKSVFTCNTCLGKAR